MSTETRSNEELFSTLAGIAKKADDERLIDRVKTELVMQIRDDLEELKRLSPDDYEALLEGLRSTE